jgi:hypothetical protein
MLRLRVLFDHGGPAHIIGYAASGQRYFNNLNLMEILCGASGLAQCWSHNTETPARPLADFFKLRFATLSCWLMHQSKNPPASWTAWDEMHVWPPG